MKDYSVSYARGLAIILMFLGHTMFSDRGNAWIIRIHQLPASQLAEFPVIKEYPNIRWWPVYLVVSLLVCALIAMLNRYIKNPYLRL